MKNQQVPKEAPAIGFIRFIFAPIRFIFSSFIIGACIKILRSLLR